jgi:hypothetical protein
MDNPYVQLTREFNEGRLRALLSSGQAVVLYRLAIMSKDGDWILREDQEALDFVLETLESHGARYRFGAPLDLRWLANGWSSHFEHRGSGLRLRCDFVTRPPRVPPAVLQAEWENPEQREVPVVNLPVLADLKKTNREKDYAIIGELARLMDDSTSALLYSRSARDLLRMAAKHPDVLRDNVPKRPLLDRVALGRDELERALDEERRSLIRSNEERLKLYMKASGEWSSAWHGLSRELAEHTLRDAHEIMVSRAEGVLPYEP